MNKYDICENCREDDFLRKAFFDFTETVFPRANFRIWHSRGHWRKEYKPFSIVRDGKVVSNVSITEMKLLMEGRPINGIQIGTVGTIPEYQNQGLSRYLMEYVMDRYRDRTDIIFLFANEDVVDFYPKFGFDRHSEMIFVSRSNIPRASFGARQLSIDSETDMALVQRLLQQRLTLTEVFGASNYDFITLWHILNIFPDNLFYLEEEDALFIVTERDDRLHIWDIVYRKPIDFSTATAKVMKSEGIKSIRYYFTPEKLNIGYDDIEIMDDSPLFTFGNFPIVKRPFKFPTTAQT